MIMQPGNFHIDVEATNRCNADCYFCPRDQTPHQGLMSMETYERTLARCIEFRDDVLRGFGEGYGAVINLCGLGEPLLNKLTPTFARMATDEGFKVTVSSNAALLDEKRGRALLDAKVAEIAINISDLGDDYEDIYNLPFERTFENILNFREMAGDACIVRIVLVDHHGDSDHISEMVKFWQDAGMSEFIGFPMMNRGGALNFDGFDYTSNDLLTRAEDLTPAGQRFACSAPFTGQFVGYDGNYYLCCSDWKKEVILGNVGEHSIAGIALDKLARVNNRDAVCAVCNLDPLNRIVDAIKALDEGDESADPAEVLRHSIEEASRSEWIAQKSFAAASDPPAGRRQIPVRAL
jgi:MoaA/NifB/PqqE/SkfB family radical SAM enzyme